MLGFPLEFVGLDESGHLDGALVLLAGDNGGAGVGNGGFVPGLMRLLQKELFALRFREIAHSFAIVGIMLSLLALAGEVSVHCSESQIEVIIYIDLKVDVIKH